MMKKTISYNTYLKAKGLFHLAQESCQKLSDYESAIARLVGSEDDAYAGHISDHIYNDGNIEGALIKEGIKILPQPHVYRKESK